MHSVYIIYICILYVRILSDYDEILTALQDPKFFCTAACFLAFLMRVALQATLFYMLDRDGVATSACTRDCSVSYPVPVEGASHSLPGVLAQLVSYLRPWVPHSMAVLLEVL